MCNGQGGARLGASASAVSWAASVGLWLVTWVEVFLWRGGVVRIPLALSGDEGFPLPLLSIAALILYTWAFGRFVARTSGPVAWATAAFLGMALHLIVLASHLAWEMPRDTTGALLSWYVRYWQAEWAVLLALGCGASIWLAGPIVRGLAGPRRAFFSPLLLGFATLWAVSWKVDLVFTASASVIGLLAAWAWRGQALGPALKAIGRFLWSERVFVTLVVLAAIGLRIFYTLRVMSQPDYINTGSDGPVYHDQAVAMLEGREGKWSYIPFLVPGYVRFVAAIYWLAGPSYFAVCVVQAVLGGLACGLMYSLAKRLFGEPTARIAAVFGAVSYPMIFASASIGHQAVDLFLTLAIVRALVWYGDAPARRLGWLPVIGAALGWAIATREGNFVFWMFLTFWFAFAVSRAIGWRRAIGHFAVLSVGVALVFGAFLVEDRRMHNRTNETLLKRVGFHWFKNSPTDIKHAFNPFLQPQQALHTLKTEPGMVARLMITAVGMNFEYLFLNQDYGRFDPVFLVRGSTFYYGMWWYALLLAFIGFGLVLATRAGPVSTQLGAWLIVTVIVSRSIVHLFMECAYRHRTPIEPYLIILAAYGLSWIIAQGDWLARLLPRASEQSA